MSSGDPKDVPPDFEEAPLPSDEHGGSAPVSDGGWDEAPLPDDDGFSPLAAEAGGYPGADEMQPPGPPAFEDGPGAGGGPSSRGDGASGGGGARPPSQKQLDFAKKLASERGVEIPAEALESGPACSRFIDEALKQAPKGGAAGAGAGAGGGAERPATERQVAFAKKLASERGVEVPKEALESSAACSRFIDAQLGKKPSGGAEGAGSADERPAAGPRPRASPLACGLTINRPFELLKALICVRGIPYSG